jgi:hypothetical protein
MLTLQAAPASDEHVTGIERGTGEQVECRYNGSAVCRGLNPSGTRLIDRVVRASQDFAYAARRLTGTTPVRRALDGTVTTADLAPVSEALRRLPTQLSLAQSTDQRTLLFVFLHDNPKAAVAEVSADPFGYMNLLTEIRQGRFGAGNLIDAPFPTVAVVGTLVAVGVIGGAAWLARR